jgi:predicted RNase H-like nuclease (RuvC/YqgF family)
MSNEEEITRLKQKCEAKIRELRQRHKLEIAVKDREIQNCNQEIAVKDSKIQDCREQIAYLRKLIMTVAERGVIYNNIEVNTTAESKSMTDSSSKNIKVGGDVTGSTLNIGEISGTVTNSINQLPASPQSDQPGIKELLTELQIAIEAETNLSDKSKALALKQVKALAEVGKNPQESTMQEAGETAMTMLKGILAGLPTTATLLEACSKLLPMIAKLLPLA